MLIDVDDGILAQIKTKMTERHGFTDALDNAEEKEGWKHHIEILLQEEWGLDVSY